MEKITTKDITYIAFAAAFLAVCSFITVPIFTIPLTMQTFGVFVILNVLGGKRGLASILVYICLGLIGLPVFSGFRGGVSVLFNATGGYIIGFIFQAIIYILIIKFFGETFLPKITALILGLALCYTFGTVWFVFVYTNTSASMTFWTAFNLCVTPYIIPDLVKLGLSYIVSSRVKKILL